MKTNALQVITATVATGLIAGLSSTKVTGDYVTGLAVATGYLVVAAIVVLAAADYRRNQRTYIA